MLTTNLFSILALSSLALALPSSPSPAQQPFQVTNLNTFEPSGRDGVTPYRVSFNVTDPNTSGGGEAAKTYCEARWPYAEATTGWPSKYLANCTDPSWKFRFIDYHSVWDFVLDVKHVTKKQGEKTKRFAKAPVDRTVILLCTHAGSGFSQCNQREGVPFALPVYRVKGE
ncbi:hypothetical protein CC80DRAFT_537593 [Byssothecium circinans]|uniref:AA1-like domain-containing protein n=1 Tax=Byssothecium circinans TaxID=147558 RepID=A0A6A5TRG4_9PLEO|nr:hypothetical protein CC80DRAFT_537593 [Byssothecium circinans]